MWLRFWFLKINGQGDGVENWMYRPTCIALSECLLVADDDDEMMMMMMMMLVNTVQLEFELSQVVLM